MVMTGTQVRSPHLSCRNSSLHTPSTHLAVELKSLVYNVNISHNENVKFYKLHTQSHDQQKLTNSINKWKPNIIFIN